MSTDWPDLPKSGFVVGRAATQKDVELGEAVFSMAGQGQTTAKIGVPQYALWSDEQGQQYPMLLVQAEEAPNGLIIVGLRDFEGRTVAATLAELTLLGSEKP
jgi:hypothetical protein